MSDEELALRVIDVLSSIDMSLKKNCEVQSSIDLSLKKLSSGPSSRIRENTALALLPVYGPNVSRIAADVGIRESTLRRYKRFMSAVGAIRKQNARA